MTDLCRPRETVVTSSFHEGTLSSDAGSTPAPADAPLADKAVPMDEFAAMGQATPLPGVMAPAPG
jgi:hypothetical protein